MSGSFSTTVVIPGDFDAFAPQRFDIVAMTSSGACTATITFELTN